MNPYGLSDEQLNKIIAVLSKHPNVIQAFVFGSRATNTFSKISDIDLALTGKNLTLAEIMRIKRELEELPIIHTFDVVCLDMLEDHAVVDRIRQEARLLYQH
jgi:uncharacterized protein